MAMGIDDIKASQFIFGECDEDPIDIPSRVDNSCPSCPLTANNITIGLNGPNYQRLEDQISPSRIEFDWSPKFNNEAEYRQGRSPSFLEFQPKHCFYKLK
jgi:hypothetical protein